LPGSGDQYRFALQGRRAGTTSILPPAPKGCGGFYVRRNSTRDRSSTERFGGRSGGSRAARRWSKAGGGTAGRSPALGAAKLGIGPGRANCPPPPQKTLWRGQAAVGSCSPAGRPPSEARRGRPPRSRLRPSRARVRGRDWNSLVAAGDRRLAAEGRTASAGLGAAHPPRPPSRAADFGNKHPPQG